MSNERVPLPGALGQIADGAAAAQAARDLAGAGLPLARMHAAARRRRVTFGAGVGVAAAAVVGVLVLGAAAAGGLIDRGPVPPVQTPDSEALPAALLDGQVPWCDEAFDVATTGDPQLSVALDQRLDDASGEVDTTITMMNDLGAGPVQMPVGFLRLVLTRDGIAVGFGDVGGDSGGTIDPGTTRVLDVYVSAECPGSEADPETGLPPGVYELWAVVPLGEDELHTGGVVDEPPMLVAGPWPFLLGAPDAVAGPDPSTTAITELPGCGESTEDLYATSGRVIGDATVKVGVLADVTTGDFLHEGYGDTLWVDTTLTNLGPDLYRTRRSVTEIVVAEDGVVVVTAQLDPADPPAGIWPGGEAKESSGSITTTRCAGAEPDILRHGQYALWARTTVEWATEPDGPVQTWSVIDWPVDFWVYDFEDPDNRGPVTWTSAGPTS